MDLEPPSLKIPLYARSWFWAKAVALAVLVAVMLLVVAPKFGVHFASTVVVGLPVLAIWLMAPVQAWLSSQVWVVRVAAMGALFVYFGFAKKVLVPLLSAWFD